MNKLMKLWLAPLALLSGHALAGGEAPMTEPMKIGMSFKAEVFQNDNQGLKKDGYTPTASTMMWGVVNPSLSLKINEKVNFFMETALGTPLASKGKCLGTLVKQAYTKLNMNDMFFVKFGCLKTSKGGWESMDRDEALTLFAAPVGPMGYLNQVPLSDYLPALMVGMNQSFGHLSLQLVDDVTLATHASWNDVKQPTAILQWKGDFGGFMPLVQVGMYDAMKSMFTNVGLKGKAADFGFTFDYMRNSFSNKVLNAEMKGTSKEDVATTVALSVNYDMPGVATPFLAYSMFEKVEYKDDATSKKDVKANSGGWTGAWDDNGNVVSVGSTFSGVGDNFWPYLAVDLVGGKFYNTDRTKEESKSEMHIKAGMTAKF